MKNKFFYLTIALTTSFLLLTGCGKKGESWAYDYDPQTEVMALYENGSAEFKGEKYKYTKDDSFIHLIKGDEKLDLRYMTGDGNITIYEKSIYKQDGTKNEGIKGSWAADNGWTFVFTADGKFSEENIFFGNYSVDEENACIKLMYDDPIPDAYLYYEINGDELTIEYPWPLVKTEAAS
ncbi:MAG: hypothetical protein K5669_00795 [Lachnospiraceae bacterium]|nr:hypothetical protein [Lachnospiraceae bacterium]